MTPLAFLLMLTLAAPAQSIPESEAIERFALRERLDTYGAGARAADPAGRVEVVEGDLHVAGDLLLDDAYTRRRVEKLRARAPGDREASDVVGLVVTGALTVDGAIINANLNAGPFLLVLGTTRARAIFGGGAELRFDGRARVSDAVVGCYNDGSLRFAGGLEAPLVLSEDHMIDIVGSGPDGIGAPEVLDPFNDAIEPAVLERVLDPRHRIDPEDLDLEQSLLPAIRRGERIARKTN